MSISAAADVESRHFAIVKIALLAPRGLNNVVPVKVHASLVSLRLGTAMLAPFRVSNIRSGTHRKFYWTSRARVMLLRLMHFTGCVPVVP